MNLARQLKRAADAAAGAQTKASAAVADRDRLILTAKGEMTYKAISAATGLSHQRIRQIVEVQRSAKVEKAYKAAQKATG